MWHIFAKAGAECTQGTFFGIPHWAAGLESKFQEDCVIEGFSLTDIWLIVANITRMALGLAALLAIIFVIVGGVMYVTSQGNPEHTKRAQDILTNAILGLVIAIFASAIVGFIAGRF